MEETKYNDTEYQSMGGNYYESTGFRAQNTQRILTIELNRYHTGETETKIIVQDCIGGFEWKGNLAELITKLKGQEK